MPLKLITAGGGSVILDANSTASTYTVNVPAQGGAMLTTGSLSGINASAISTGTMPKANLPAGSILQVKSTTFSSASYTSSSTSTSFVDSGLYVTFDNNLRDSNSKVLAVFDIFFGQTDASSAWATVTYGTIYEGGVNRGDSSYGLIAGNSIAGSGGSYMQYDASSLSGSCLFTPSTTTTPTVRFYYKSQNGYITSYINRMGNSSYPGASTMTIMEIAG